MTRNRQAKRWGSPTHTNTHERGKLNSADVGSLTNRAPNQKETTCMALHRGGSFETHEDNLAVFANEKHAMIGVTSMLYSFLRTMPTRRP